MIDLLWNVFELFEIKVSQRVDVGSKEQSAKIGVDEVKTSTKSDAW